MEAERETCQCVLNVRAKPNIWWGHSKLHKYRDTLSVSIFDEGFFGIQPFRMALKFGYGFWYVVVKISFLCVVIELFCKLCVIHIAFGFWIEVVCQIVDLPILKDCHLLQFILKLSSRHKPILVFIEIAKNFLGLSVHIHISHPLQTFKGRILIKVWRFLRLLNWKRSQSPETPVESSLCFLRSLWQKGVELFLSYFFSVIVVKVRSIAIVVLFSKVDALGLQKIFCLKQQLIFS